jgi:hypothetical protein
MFAAPARLVSLPPSALDHAISVHQLARRFDTITADDRMVSIELRRIADETAGNGVGIGMWWQPAPAQ